MEWISVNDRLPDRDVEVLVVCEDKCIDVYYYDEDIWRGWNVTHWMELPKAP